MEIDFGGQGEIVFERRGKAGLVRLTRPKALNALTRTMVNAFHRAPFAPAVTSLLSFTLAGRVAHSMNSLRTNTGLTPISGTFQSPIFP
jgi:hypothetical protein